MKDQTVDSKKKNVTKPAVLTKEGTKMKDQKKEAMILNGGKEELVAIEKKAATRKDNRLMLNAVKDSLEELHKYQCASDKHRADLEKDADIKPIPHQEIYRPGISVPDGLTQEQQKEFFEAELEQRGATPEKFEEYRVACDQHSDAEMDHQFEASYYTAMDIFNLIDNQKCEKCGEHHAEPTNWARDRVLMALLEGAAARLIKSDEYGHWGKADALERVIAMATDAYISHEGNTEVVNDAAFTNIINSVALALPNHRRHVFENGTVSLMPTNLKVGSMSAHKSMEQQLKGATVVGIFKQSDEYRKESGWDFRGNGDDGVTIVFSNGVRIHSQQDAEGNGPGHMVFEETSGDQYHIFPDHSDTKEAA